MGNTPSTLTTHLDRVPVVRYTVETTIRYKGTFKGYIYESAEYGVSVDPSDPYNPVRPYDPERFRGTRNEKKTVYVKRSLLLHCQEFLKQREFITNEIQKALEVA